METQQQWYMYAVQWWMSNLHLKINNIISQCWSHREAHLLWQSEVRGRARQQNGSLELAGSQCLAQWHFSRCSLTSWVMWVKASLSDHLSTLGKYVKVNLVYSLTLSSMQQFFFHLFLRKCSEYRKIWWCIITSLQTASPNLELISLCSTLLNAT